LRWGVGFELLILLTDVVEEVETEFLGLLNVTCIWGAAVSM
jgi:hypothetical protein